MISEEMYHCALCGAIDEHSTSSLRCRRRATELEVERRAAVFPSWLMSLAIWVGRICHAIGLRP